MQPDFKVDAFIFYFSYVQYQIISNMSITSTEIKSMLNLEFTDWLPFRA